MDILVKYVQTFWEQNFVFSIVRRILKRPKTKMMQDVSMELFNMKLMFLDLKVLDE
jgi:hypothetical protein